MKSQATRLTTKEAAYWDFWTGKGYVFKPGEKPPLTTLVAPARPVKRPVLNVVLAVLVISVALSLFGYWFATAAKLI
jgi:hypothetical protein